MKKIFSILLALILGITQTQADEGMWLIQHLEEVYPQMVARGLKMPLNQLYATNNQALSGAVVAIDGGVGTGSVISDEGLLITNHHVAYSDICALSTTDRNLLETGFWARTHAEEIPIKGKTVSFLHRVEDVTEEALTLKAQMKSEGRWGVMSMRRLVSQIEKRHAQEGFEVSCVGMWRGLKFYLYTYEVFRDVRLVG